MNQQSSNLSLVKEMCFSQTGQELFESIVTKLPAITNLDFMFIGEGNLDLEVVKTVAFSEHGQLKSNFTYHLENSPCQLVFEQDTCVVPESVQAKFPKDLDLINWQVEGYIGHVLKDREGKKIGLIVGLSQSPISYSEDIINLFSIISNRTSIEIEQLNTIKLLRASLQETKNVQNVFNEHNLVSSTDLKGNITYVNEKFCEVSGYTREELMGQNHRIIKSDEHSLEFYRDLWKTIANGKVWKGTVKNTKKGGGHYWVDATIAPMFDQDGNITHYVSARTNITEQKDFEKKANTLRQEAERLSKIKSMFLANMSHEIRTPLNGIVGSTSILLDSKLTKEQKELALMIHHSTKSLNVVVNDILDFSKIEAGKLRLEKLVIDYKYIVNDVIKLYSDQAQKKGIKIKSEFPKEYPQTLIADPTRLRQILTNLISNAIKFTHQGQINIKVSFDQEDENNYLIKTVVKDSGIGMNQNQLDGLFEVFNQADNTTTRMYGGTGLGASICKKLVELQGGTLKVSSKVNHGTKFTYKIPAAVSNQKYLNEETTKKPERNYKKTVIIAEDNKVNLKLAELTLKSLGLKTISAKNGLEAVEKANQHDHDLLLMDIQMPKLNGIEACEQLIKSGYKKPILAMTANVMEEDIKKYFEVGMVDCIPKPFKIHDIVSKLDKVIKK